ncbi:type II secretion system major pseudopilin GspG [Sphingobium cupriresistens]|uniref:Type II secretion system core protein G n=1 Tax=Sphingobium cupriresistens TaxID=1132417 RepID=A0A8G2DYL5_9SPHN|nr:type II secretion system major pseudopilin GspG [Sphingobium cupriresistens]RYM12259.1 type II secretion system protein GspG [Sphingobium cupriresistens]
MFNLKSVRAELVEALSGFKTKEKPFDKLRANGDETSGEAGFTLVELMVVIVIIGLLATIVAINVIPATDTARVEKAKADIATIEQALEQYRLDNLTYPAGSDGLQALLTPPASLAQPQRYRRGGYIKKLPDDPWGRAYVYTVPGRKGAFDISSLGADGQPGGESENADIYSSEL